MKGVSPEFLRSHSSEHILPCPGELEFTIRLQLGQVEGQPLRPRAASEVVWQS